MRKLVYYVATTADGFIAAEDGSFDFALQEGEHFADLFAAYPETIPGHLREQLNVTGDNQRFDTVLMGRNTYEVGLEFDVTNPYPHLRQFLFSRSMQESPDENVTLVSENASEAVKELKKKSGKDIWLCGGGSLASALFDEIDELILKVNPTLLGAGISLFVGGIPMTRLDLTAQKIYENGFLLLTYRKKRL